LKRVRQGVPIQRSGKKGGLEERKGRQLEGFDQCQPLREGGKKAAEGTKGAGHYSMKKG